MSTAPPGAAGYRLGAAQVSTPGVPAPFLALCEQGQQSAAVSGGPVLVSWSTELTDVAVAALIARLPRTPGRTFVWSSPWSGERFVAAGSALDLPGRGGGRIDQVNTAWQRARTGALVGGSGAGPRLVGCLGFDPGDRPDPAPAAHPDPAAHRDHAAHPHRTTRLPDALMWVPAAVIAESPGSGTVLTLTALIEPGAGITAALAAAEAAAHRLVTGDTEAHRHPAAERCRWETPAAPQWKQLVGEAVDAIHAGVAEKIVLSRQLTVEFDAPVEPAPVLSTLLDTTAGTVFAAQLDDSWFLGRTPECLLRLQAGRADTIGLAGSMPRDADSGRDAELARQLLADPKLVHEHGVVTDVIMATLGRYFDEVTASNDRPVLKLAEIQHHETLITATGARTSAELLDIAAAMHPTPAVGGHPSAPALQWLRDNEPLHRQWFAAPIGWVGADGDGELGVAIRSALLTADTAVVYAGCGLVEGSDREVEYDETRIKMQQMLTVLGVAGDGAGWS